MHPNDLHLLVFVLCTCHIVPGLVFVTNSIWQKYNMSFLRLGYKKDCGLCHSFLSPSLFNYLPWGSKVPCCVSSPGREAHRSENWSLWPTASQELRPGNQVIGLEVDSLAPGEPSNDYTHWAAPRFLPFETVWINGCYFRLLRFGIMYSTVIDNKCHLYIDGHQIFISNSELSVELPNCISNSLLSISVLHPKVNS